MDASQKAVLEKLDLDGLMRLISGMIKIPSVTGTPGETEVALFLAREVEKLGFKPKLYEVRGYGVPAPGRPNVVFRLEGSGGGPTLMFNGHLDTEPIPPGYAEIGEDPFSGRIDTEDGHMYGVGAMNMKAAVAAYVYGIKALRDAGVPLKGDIIFAGVIGEMEYGLGTRYLLHCGITADMVINGEPTDLGIAPIHASSYDFSIRLKGKPTHMSFPEMGVHVAPKMADLVKAIMGMKVTYNEKKYKDILPPRVNISYVKGGLEFKTGLFMGECTINLCVRTPVGPTLQSITEDIEAVLDRFRSEDPEFVADLLPLNPQFPFCPPFEVQLKEYVVQAARRAHLDIRGKEPHLMFKYGYLDSGVIKHAIGSPAAICGLGGPKTGTGSFTPPERVPIKDIEDLAKIYTLAALDICTKDMEEIKPHHKLPLDPNRFDTSF
jgi:acetylornithine deacetylase